MRRAARSCKSGRFNRTASYLRLRVRSQTPTSGSKREGTGFSLLRSSVFPRRWGSARVGRPTFHVKHCQTRSAPRLARANAVRRSQLSVYPATNLPPVGASQRPLDSTQGPRQPCDSSPRRALPTHEGLRPTGATPQRALNDSPGPAPAYTAAFKPQRPPRFLGRLGPAPSGPLTPANHTAPGSSTPPAGLLAPSLAPAEGLDARVAGLRAGTGAGDSGAISAPSAPDRLSLDPALGPSDTATPGRSISAPATEEHGRLAKPVQGRSHLWIHCPEAQTGSYKHPIRVLMPRLPPPPVSLNPSNPPQCST